MASHVTFPFSSMLDSMPLNTDEKTTRFIELLASKISFNNMSRIELLDNDTSKTIIVKVNGFQIVSDRNVAMSLYKFAENNENVLIKHSTYQLAFYDVINYKHENILSFAMAVFVFELLK
jgi:hypothetical protein